VSAAVAPLDPRDAELARGVAAGERRALARAITLTESTRADHRARADQLLNHLLARTGGAVRVGVSGVPGVGKSTFVEALGMMLIGRGLKVAVLAVDPSSVVSGGSILGDKTRMERLSQRLEAFIRPSPAGRTLGGVTRHTRETIVLVEAAGFDVVLVETVGVGQSETAVAAMTDLFLLLLLPGAGDELQGIKRGIVELADLIIVNKADGELSAAAGRAAADYRNALHLLRARSAHWQVPVETVSALEERGIDRVWELVTEYRRVRVASGEFQANRADQARTWLRSEVAENLLGLLDADPTLATRLRELDAAVAAGQVLPRVAADELTHRLRQQLAAAGTHR
jgi:LAO/AO transport system kinase